jgi:hypothetical protein
MRTNHIMATCVLLFMMVYINVAANDLYDINTIHTVQLEFEQANWWQLLENNEEAEQNILATLIVDDQVFDSVGVQFRGNTSSGKIGDSQKKSFNIELDWMKNQELMGYEELNLLNCYQDPTFMREVLYSNACRDVLPSAKVNFVKLVIHDENWGIYASVQQLDGTFIREWFPSNEGTRWRGGTGRNRTGGRPGGGGVQFNPGSALQYQGADSTKYAEIYEIKNTNQESPWDDLIYTCDVLNNTPTEQLSIELPKAFNIDRALWLCAFEIVFQDDDGYMFKRGSDYYLYYEPESDRIHFIQYDANTCMVLKDSQWSPFYREDDPDVPVMSLLMPIQEYRQRYLAHVRAIVDNYLNEDYLVQKIDTYKALIESEVMQDSKKLYTNSDFDSGINTLKSFITQRRNFLLSNQEVKQPAPTIFSVERKVTDRDYGQQLTISAAIDANMALKEVNLFLAEGDYEPFTSLVMADDGENGDAVANDNTYSIQLPTYVPGTLVRYYVQAIADDNIGAMTFEPFAEHKASRYVVTYSQADDTSVIINELMAQNNTTYADPQGDYDDWIEIKNISSEVVDLSGMYLSDKLENPLKWQFPEGVTIDPGGFLIVWTDEDGNAEDGIHANFKLSANGETVLLFGSDDQGNALLDSASFSSQSADRSYGRHPNTIDEWLIFAIPTPGLENSIQSDLNENVVAVADKFQLWPAFPNPFNPLTTISFSLPAASKVSLKIYNTVGQLMTTLVDEQLAQGNHEFQWHALQMSSGIYFYTLTSGSFSQTKRMILLK